MASKESPILKFLLIPLALAVYKAMQWIKSHKTLSFLALLVLLFLIPVFVKNLYYIGVLTALLMNVLLVVSFWFNMSTGQPNFGHAAFAAIGAYLSAALITSWGFSSWLSLPIAVIATGIIALILGLITLRITGVYFLITTMALASVIQIIFGVWENPFGGLVGLLNLPAPDPISIPGLFTIEFTSKPAIYYLTLIFSTLGILVLYRLHTSSMGRIFRSIDSSNTLAEHVGINIMGYKVLVFIVTCMCAALAGVLYTYSMSAIQPTSFSFTQGIYYLVYATVGGLGHFAGPIIGTVFLRVISEFLRPVQDYETIIFALLLISVIMVFRQGLYGMMQKTGDIFTRWLKKHRDILADNDIK